jgi:hypothetical protein
MVTRRKLIDSEAAEPNAPLLNSLIRIGAATPTTVAKALTVVAN